MPQSHGAPLRRPGRAVPGPVWLSARGRGGFTLVEMAVAITILSILLAIGTTVMNRARANRQLDASANELLNVCKYARQLAQTQGGASIAFAFPSGGTATWTVADGSSQTLKVGTIPSDIVMTLPAGTNPLTYRTNGSLTTGGVITMVSSTTGRTGQLTLNQTTGAATLSIQ